MSSRAPAGRLERLAAPAGRAAREFVTVPSVSHHAAVAGQHDVGQLGRLREEHVLHDQVVEPLEQAVARVTSASDCAGFSPRQYTARSSPCSMASNIAVRCLP